MNNKTSKNLIVTFGALAILFFSANSAQAYVPGVWDPQPRVQTNGSAFVDVPVVNNVMSINNTSTNNTTTNSNINSNTSNSNSVNPSVYAYNNPNNNALYPNRTVSNNTSNTSSTTYNRVVTTPARVVNPNANYNTVVYPTQNTGYVQQQTGTTSGYVNTTANTTNGNDLSALSINGSGSFMPSSVFQWFLTILLILAIIIIARMIIRHSANHKDSHVANY